MHPVRRFAVAAGAVAALGLAGCSTGHGSTQAFCDQVAQVPSLEAVLSRFSETDPDVLADRIDKARAAYHDLADAAPGSISKETDDVVSLVDDVLDAAAAHPSDPEQAAAQLRKAMADHPDVATSRSEVTAFAQEQCGVRLDPVATDGTTTTAPATTSTAPSTTGG